MTPWFGRYPQCQARDRRPVLGRFVPHHIATRVRRSLLAVVIAISVVASLPVSAAFASAGSSVVNGDFSSGDTGFTSDYAAGVGLGAPQTYAVGSDPSTFNAWPHMGDHTTGTGLMMIVNGATTANQRVWSETLSVTPNSSYAFSMWVASLYSDPALLRLSVNGTTIGAEPAPSAIGVWRQIVAPWQSSSATTAVLSITDDNLDYGGNDFALDDIVFTWLPAPALTLSGKFEHTTPIQTWSAQVCDGEVGRAMACWIGMGQYSAQFTTSWTYVQTGSTSYLTLDKDGMFILVNRASQPNLGIVMKPIGGTTHNAYLNGSTTSTLTKALSVYYDATQPYDGSGICCVDPNRGDTDARGSATAPDDEMRYPLPQSTPFVVGVYGATVDPTKSDGIGTSYNSICLLHFPSGGCA